MSKNDRLSITESLAYLSEQHAIKLGSAGLRSHIRGNRYFIEPALSAEYNKTSGMWYVSSSALDAWAARYKALKVVNKQLGGANKKGVKRA